MRRNRGGVNGSDGDRPLGDDLDTLSPILDSLGGVKCGDESSGDESSGDSGDRDDSGTRGEVTLLL
jgi:hypothetical protein